MKFGERLKEQRLLHNMKQEDLAKLLNVNRSTIAGYESQGKQTDYKRLVWLADFFEVSVDYLLGREYSSKKVMIIDNLSLESQKKLYEFKELLMKAEQVDKINLDRQGEEA